MLPCGNGPLCVCRHGLPLLRAKHGICRRLPARHEPPPCGLPVAQHPSDHQTGPATSAGPPDVTVMGHCVFPRRDGLIFAMPELPEAEVVARQIRDRLVGAALTDTWIGRADIVREGFRERGWYAGSVLRSAERFGKSVALGFERQCETRYIVAELGMTGLLLFPSVRPRFPQHIHVRMRFSGGLESELRYWNPRRFGRLSMLDPQGLKDYL